MANTIGFLKVDSGELLEASAQLSGYLEMMRNCFSELKQRVEGTASYWTGDAGDAHRMLYQEQAAATEEILRRYQEHVTDLNAMAGVYDQAEEVATGMSEELPDSAL